MTLDLSRLKSDRKLRLFACGCCRAVWDRLTDPRSRAAVEVAERYADGKETESQRAEAWYRAVSVGVDDSGLAFASARCAEHLYMTPGIVSQAVGKYASPDLVLACVAGPDPLPTLCGGQHFDRFTGFHDGRFAGEDYKPCESCSRILAWNEGTLRNIAAAIYESRAWGGLPVLADALEDAGCGVESILRHLRADGGECPECDFRRRDLALAERCPRCHNGRLPAAHARGCFVLDLILGKS